MAPTLAADRGSSRPDRPVENEVSADEASAVGDENHIFELSGAGLITEQRSTVVQLRARCNDARLFEEHVAPGPFGGYVHRFYQMHGASLVLKRLVLCRAAIEITIERKYRTAEMHRFYHQRGCTPAEVPVNARTLHAGAQSSLPKS
jgi:hypothetical protein